MIKQVLALALLFLVGCAQVRTVISSSETRKSFGVSGPTILAELPALSLKNLKKGQLIAINCDFIARSNGGSRSNGFYYNIMCSDVNAVESLTPNDAIFQSSAGWQTAGLKVFFRTTKNVEKLDFFLNLEKRDVKGNGQIGNVVWEANFLNSKNYRFN